MLFLILILSIFFISVILIPLVQDNRKGVVAMAGVITNAVLSSILAYNGLFKNVESVIINGGQVFGDIPFRIDALSGWFLFIMNFTSITAIIYGNHYLKTSTHDSSRLSMHYISYMLNHLAMIGIYTIQNTLAFLCVWELMAVTAFILIIFDYHKMEILKAGINYLIQSHISILFLMLAFIWVNFKTGSYDFASIAYYSNAAKPAFGFLLFFCFFIGFAIKAGFVPFHTWLPYAHPAAPAHISGLMSGVIIKLGIYGILRMLLLIEVNYLLIGTIILIISVISGVYGVMLAILQHNLKKLLAYHSIENIGIIGIGIGLGAIGKGIGNTYLEFAGFAGALLHTLNHSLFKSLLFYAAGSVYQLTHIINIERLGGLIKKLPHTSFLFLLASVAICGLPPFNGFISEFLIYTGLFNAINNNQLSHTVLIILSIFGLVLIGGLALFCFTKAFGIAFLGIPRSHYPDDMKETGKLSLLSKYAVALIIVVIGLLPQVFIKAVAEPVALFSGNIAGIQPAPYFLSVMQKVGWASWTIILIVLIIFFIRDALSRKSLTRIKPTWGCGYEVASPKLQYTSGSFSRSYRNLIKPLVKVYKHEDRINTIIPGSVKVESHVADKIESFFIDIPVRNLRSFIGRFKFLQNGSVQFYILYGVVFIFIAITIPTLIHAFQDIIELFKQL